MGKTDFIKPIIDDAVRGILDLLGSGRADEVTDAMLDLGDPVMNARLNEALWQNYDLPMDYASRMARAAEMGLSDNVYHSSLKDLREVSPVGKFMGYTGTSGFSVSSSPLAASRYLDRFANFGWVDGVPNRPFDKNVIPLSVNLGRIDYRDAPYENPGVGMGAPLPQGYVPRHVQLGFDTAAFDDAISARGPVKHSDAKNAIRSTEYVMSDPTKVRSRFARFDPRLAHLKNLNAALAGGAGVTGLLSMSPEEAAAAEIDAYLKGKR